MKYADLSMNILLLLPTLFLSAISGAIAGDTRSVSEPVVPQSCQMLKASGAADSTSYIQDALNACTSGKAVYLTAATGSSAFYSGPLKLPSGVSLRVDKGVTLLAIANPSLFDNGNHTCGTLDDTGKGCNPFIQIKNASSSGIYGPGSIDGQGNAIMTGKSQSWWQLATAAKNKNTRQNAPRLIQIDNSKNITLYQITLKNGPNFHVVSNDSNGLTLWGITIATPANARNTDGFDPMGSQNVTLIHSRISTGDDNVAIKAGSASSAHISILDNHFGTGHGMSIGSEINQGVSDVTVDSLTLSGTTNGLRIKSDSSRGGKVTDVTYENICMQNVKNPIVLDTRYDSAATGSLIPVYRDITFRNLKVLTAGTFTFAGYSASRPLSLTLDNVHISKGSVWHKQYAIVQGTVVEDGGGSCDDEKTF